VNRLSSLYGSLFLLPLAGFWISYFAGKPVPDPMGNRFLVKFPALARALPSEAWLQQAASSLIEHAPLRYRTIQIRNHIFSAAARWMYPIPVNPGHPDLCSGKDGWLFLLNETPSYRPEKDLLEIAKRSVDIGRLVQESGRRFYFVPFPDKASIYPEYSGSVKRWAEGKANRALLPVVLAKAWSEAPGLKDCFISTWQPLLQAKTERKEFLYWARDTHWNYAGMVTATRALVNGIQPGLFEDDSVVADGISMGSVDGGQDLSTIFLLQDGAIGAPRYAIRREKENQESVIKGRTLLIGDSFTALGKPIISPWFENLVFASHAEMGSPGLGKSIAASDTIIWTSVEREMPLRLETWTRTQLGYLKKYLTPKKPAAP
jgi:hypothetical protein